jgi:hypothetical protein
MRPSVLKSIYTKKNKLLQLTDDDTRKIISPNLDSTTVKRFLDLSANEVTRKTIGNARTLFKI